MSAFLIIIGFILTFLGMIFGPHIFHKHIRNTQEVKAMGLDDKWADWSWNFINEEKWITTLYTDA